MNKNEIEARKRAGAAAARQSEATEKKEFGQTSETVYPYTYWWIVGYNEEIK